MGCLPWCSQRAWLVAGLLVSFAFGAAYNLASWALFMLYGQAVCESPLGRWLYYTALNTTLLLAATLHVNVAQAVKRGRRYADAADEATQLTHRPDDDASRRPNAWMMCLIRLLSVLAVALFIVGSYWVLTTKRCVQCPHGTPSRCGIRPSLPRPQEEL